MAYKEESDQQFLETIVRQVSNGIRRPTGDAAYHGNVGWGNDDDSFATGDDGHEAATTADFITARRPLSGFGSEYGRSETPDTAQFEPMPKLGGYSSESGSRHLEPNYSGSSELRDRVRMRLDMRKIINSIKDKERELHELQQQKVELMRKITGRLE